MRSPAYAVFVLAISLNSLAHAQEADPRPPAELRQHINPPRQDGKENAAFEYLRIWDTITGPDANSFQQHQLWFPPRHPYREAFTPEADSDKKEREFLDRHADAVEALIRAAAMP